MKPVFAIAVTIVLSLVFSLAFADDLAIITGKDLGLVLSESSVAAREAPPTMITEVPKAEVFRDIGLDLYESHLAFEAEKGAIGIEAGGVTAKEVEKSFDYLGPGGSDLP